jgi:MFS family permease
VSAGALVTLVCGAQVLAQLGAFFWPALLPGMITLWGLSNSQAGWITAAFYAAYMVSVPVLVTLTDRFDAKYVYLFGVAAWLPGTCSLPCSPMASGPPLRRVPWSASDGRERT